MDPLCAEGAHERPEGKEGIQMQDLIKYVEQSQLRDDLPELAIGDLL